MKVVALLLALSASNASSTKVEFGKQSTDPKTNCIRRCGKIYRGCSECIASCVSGCQSERKGGSLRGATTNLSFRSSDMNTNPKFEFVGNGFCLDSQSDFYSSLAGYGLSNANDCSTWCLRSPDHLLGFSYDASNRSCLCDYESGQLPSPRQAGSAPLFSNGSGPITSSLGGSSNVKCYAYNKQ